MDFCNITVIIFLITRIPVNEHYQTENQELEIEV